MALTRIPFVLLAEDETITRFVWERALATLGCRVSVAADGLEAIQKIENGKFDLLILDFNMPYKNGLEVAEWARKISPEIPIVIITANIKNVSGLTSNLVNAIYPKPFDCFQFFHVLTRFVPHIPVSLRRRWE